MCGVTIITISSFINNNYRLTLPISNQQEENVLRYITCAANFHTISVFLQKNVSGGMNLKRKTLVIILHNICFRKHLNL